MRGIRGDRQTPDDQRCRHTSRLSAGVSDTGNDELAGGKVAPRVDHAAHVTGNGERRDVFGAAHVPVHEERRPCCPRNAANQREAVCKVAGADSSVRVQGLPSRKGISSSSNDEESRERIVVSLCGTRRREHKHETEWENAHSRHCKGIPGRQRRQCSSGGGGLSSGLEKVRGTARYLCTGRRSGAGLEQDTTLVPQIVCCTISDGGVLSRRLCGAVDVCATCPTAVRMRLCRERWCLPSRPACTPRTCLHAPSRCECHRLRLRPQPWETPQARAALHSSVRFL